MHETDTPLTNRLYHKHKLLIFNKKKKKVKQNKKEIIFSLAKCRIDLRYFGWWQSKQNKWSQQWVNTFALLGFYYSPSMDFHLIKLYTYRRTNDISMRFSNHAAFDFIDIITELKEKKYIYLYATHLRIKPII